MASKASKSVLKLNSSEPKLVNTCPTKDVDYTKVLELLDKRFKINNTVSMTKLIDYLSKQTGCQIESQTLALPNESNVLVLIDEKKLILLNKQLKETSERCKVLEYLLKQKSFSTNKLVLSES